MHASINPSLAKWFYSDIELFKMENYRFDADKVTDYSLKVSRESGTSIFKNNGKDHIALKVDTCISENSTQSAEQTVQIRLYKFDSKSGHKAAGFGTVFRADAAEDIIFKYENQAKPGKAALDWKAAIRKGADTGTYRLEFLYNNRVEYLDFVVIK
jgi:hypothetical protein